MYKSKNTPLLILISFFFYHINYGQSKTFVVQDSITKKVLPYVNVNLLNGFGFYSGENGQITIPEGKCDDFELSYVGYKTKKINVKNTERIIYLSESITELQEVVLRNEPFKKGKKNVIKPRIDKSNKDFYYAVIGHQLAFYIPGERSNCNLNSIKIPIISQAPKFRDSSNKLVKPHFKTLVKIEILKSDLGMPSQKLNEFEQYGVIDSESATDYFDIAFKDEIGVPEKGLFVMLTFIGKLDVNDKLIAELPYTETTIYGKRVKMSNSIYPQFPLVPKPKGLPVYVRYIFNKEFPWESVHIPKAATPETIGTVTDSNFYNIEFGYTTIRYE